MTSADQWWPIADAAQFVDVSERTIRRWVHDQRLTHRDRNGVTLVDLDELVQLLDQRGPGGRLPKTPRTPDLTAPDSDRILPATSPVVSGPP